MTTNRCIVGPGKYMGNIECTRRAHRLHPWAEMAKCISPGPWTAWRAFLTQLLEYRRGVFTSRPRESRAGKVRRRQRSARLRKGGFGEDHGSGQDPPWSCFRGRTPIDRHGVVLVARGWDGEEAKASRYRPSLVQTRLSRRSRFYSLSRASPWTMHTCEVDSVSTWRKGRLAPRLLAACSSCRTDKGRHDH